MGFGLADLRRVWRSVNTKAFSGRKSDPNKADGVIRTWPDRKRLGRTNSLECVVRIVAIRGIFAYTPHF